MKKILICLLLIMLCFTSFEKKVYANEISNKNVNINILAKKYEVKDVENKKRTIIDSKNKNKKTKGTDIIKCKDFEIFHSFWLVIEIIAPILVIVFGSIDFIKSVIASDEKKMMEARKKFPKRLIAGLLIFLVFSIVNIVVGLSKNTGASDTSLIKCIVNGK